MPAVDGMSHLGEEFLGEGLFGEGLLGERRFGERRFGDWHPRLERALFHGSTSCSAPGFHSGKHCLTSPGEVVFKENHDVEDAEAKQGWLGDGVVTSYAIQ